MKTGFYWLKVFIYMSTQPFDQPLKKFFVW